MTRILPSGISVSAEVSKISANLFYSRLHSCVAGLFFMHNELKQHLQQIHSSLNLTGLRGSAASLVASIIGQNKTCCVLLADEHQVTLFEQDLSLFSSHPILAYPGYEIPPYTPLSPDQRTTASRLSALYRLETATKPQTLIISVEAFMRRVVPKKLINSQSILLMAENDTDRDDFIRSLESLGYERVALVQSVGDFSVRGGIIDIFPPPFPSSDADEPIIDSPLRIDFFGDTVETIKCFDPISQRSYKSIDEATLLPVQDTLLPSAKSSEARKLSAYLHKKASELNWEETPTAKIDDRIKNGLRYAGMEFFLPLFYQEYEPHACAVADYLPEDTVFILVDPQAVYQSAELVTERILANYSEAQHHRTPAFPPNDIFILADDLAPLLKKFNQVCCTDFPAPGTTTFHCNTRNHQLLKQDISLQRKNRGLLAPLTDQILAWQKQGDHVVLCCRSSQRTKNLAELLQRFHHSLRHLKSPVSLETITAEIPYGELMLCDHPLTSGFSLNDDGIHFLSESELFGEMRLGTKPKSRKVKGEPVLFTELQDGDIVVHRDHGLGIYCGLVTMEFQSVKNDFMLLEYRDGDKLYLPVDRLNLITRYEGIAEQRPKIDKLGTQAWKTTKAKVSEEVWKVAQELLDIYARREIQQGHQFSAPGEMYEELEESFPYDETPGQLKAINETIDDLTSEKSMDRLVCGDVGYGKTEVAVRAAFKVVEDGHQVALLVPTTVLAEQHAKTFMERLQGFPVTIACLNRFRTTSEQRSIIKDLKEGRIDVIIGTHRLLSKDVVFQKLGLLIVDEEHRFGVSHKEKIKKMRSDVDILTLTATPIPRTLQMSLLGIRDLSVISSPPEQRRPVKTFVAQYDDLVIKEAVTREMRRNGQVFFVHNRVKSIHRMAATIQKLVPGARIAVAHGQMAGKELEDIMVSFVNKEIDVLLCTTIIESGLDIPTANTIIIDRAERLGLAEIYQLRGRVGRSNLQSYAYLLVPSLDALSKDSKERLRALMDCNELGGGFKLAMSDLQIRGGGNLLGISQSGNIAAIGYDLYLDLLQKTVADLKNRGADSVKQVDEYDPEINLQLSAYIPEDYIHDISQRYVMYRRIAALSTGSDTDRTDLEEEMIDRYGPLPKETVNLYSIVSLKKELLALRIAKLEKAPDALVFSFLEDTPVSPEKLFGYLQKHSSKKQVKPPRLTPDGRLVVPGRITTIDDLFSLAGTILTDLTSLTS